MNEYKLLGTPMVLFSAQIACTYLNSFHNGKKARKSVGWAAWGIYIVFQYWAMASNASRPLLVLIINMLLIFFVYKASYLEAKREKLKDAEGRHFYPKICMIILIILIIGIVFTTVGSSSKLFLLACTIVAVSKLLERTQAIEEN